MHYLLILIIILLFPLTAYGAQPDLKAQVAQQIERIKTSTDSSSEPFFGVPITLGSDGPTARLIGYGMDAIPHLVPYLSDTSLTQVYRFWSNGPRKPLAVNEYVIYVINKIANHLFYFPASNDGSATDFVPLQKQISLWWREQRTKSLLERKIADINDPDHPNRFAAYEWLGDAGAREARLGLEGRIAILLTGAVDSLKQAEMTACAEALGRIGERTSAPAIRSVAQQLFYWINKDLSYKSTEHGRSVTSSQEVSNLFKVYRALAALGLKDEALSPLRELATKYLNEMEPSTQKEFRQHLDEAERW